MKESKIFSNHNLAEKVHYVYRITIDGKYYIGKRTGCLNDLATGAYATSSKLVHEKLQNGCNFSKIKILQVFSTAKEALEFENKILTRVNAKANPKFLNQCNGNGNYTLKQHTQKSKEKMSKKAKERFDINTEEGRKRRERQSNKRKEFFNPETEEGRKRRESISKREKERFNPETEEGRKNLEKRSQISKSIFDINTEEGRRNLEKQSQISKAQFDKNTEEGRKRREKQRQSGQAQFNPNTEEGRRNRENMSKIQRNNWDENTEEGRERRKHISNKIKERFNPETEEGRRNLEKQSQISKALFDPNTERGRINLEKQRQISLAIFDKNTEEGRKRCKSISKSQIEYFNPETEQGRKRREHMSNKRREKAKEQLQKRQNDSILGELMFDEAFIKENLLFLDDKNNPRFLSSVYSKLSGYSESHIRLEKRKGKLKFLHGIESIKLSEEDENSKIEAIEAIIKSRNEELSLKAF